MNPPKLAPTATRLRTIPLKSILIAFLFALVFSLALAPAASARPCCESCDGWEDGEPPIGYDYCWDNCRICSGGGGLPCASTPDCDPGFACVSGVCVFVGGELRASNSLSFIENSTTLKVLYPNSTLSFLNEGLNGAGCGDSVATKKSEVL